MYRNLHTHMHTHRYASDLKRLLCDTEISWTKATFESSYLFDQVRHGNGSDEEKKVLYTGYH